MIRKPLMTLVNSQPFFPMLTSERREEILTSRIDELEATIQDVLDDGMNEYDPIPSWATEKLRKVIY